jgi:hypothetical protein
MTDYEVGWMGDTEYDDGMDWDYVIEYRGAVVASESPREAVEVFINGLEKGSEYAVAPPDTICVVEREITVRVFEVGKNGKITEKRQHPVAGKYGS